MNLLGKMEGFFHEVKVIFINRGPKQEGKKNEVLFFYGKVTTLGWDPDIWRWVDGGHFLNYTTKDGRDSIINRTREILGRRTNDKVISRITIGFLVSSVGPA